MNNYDYPEGADDITAPWNESEDDPYSFESFKNLCLSQTLSKEKLCTASEADFKNNLYDVLIDNEFYNPLYLLNEFKKMCENILYNKGRQYKEDYLKTMIKNCENWSEDDYETIVE